LYIGENIIFIEFRKNIVHIAGSTQEPDEPYFLMQNLSPLKNLIKNTANI